MHDFFYIGIVLLFFAITLLLVLSMGRLDKKDD